MLFYQLKLSLHLAAFGVQLLTLRCGRGHATQVAASVGAFASPQEADQFIEAKAEEFKQMSLPAQNLQAMMANRIREKVLTDLGQVMKERGLLPTDPTEADQKLKRLEHGLPHGKTTDGMATLYGFGELTEKVMERHTATKPAATTPAATAAPAPAEPKKGKTATAAKSAPAPTAAPTSASASTVAEARLAALRDRMARYPLPPNSRRAVEEYAPNRARCRNCGQYASIKYGHVCPLTANAPAFDKALQRRMKLPTGAFSYVDAGSGNRLNGLQALIDEARPEPHQVEFVNPNTGEIVKTTLDGSMLALQQGLVPHQWLVASRTRAKSKPASAAAPVQVVTPTGAVAWVLDSRGLPAPTTPATPVEAAALASGLDPSVVQTGTSLHHATYGRRKRAAIITGPASFAPVAATPAAIGITTAPPSATLTLSGGSDYDEGRFSGNEWRKGRGEYIIDDTVTPPKSYRVGDSRSLADYYSYIRHAGLYGPSPSSAVINIKVGNNLVKAAILLKKSQATQTPDGKIEVRNDTDGLVAVYDPETNQLGSIYEPTNESGQPCASPEQWAAFMAAVAADPQTAAEEAFARDVAEYLEGRTGANALAVSDGAYIVLKKKFEAGETFNLGNTIGGATHCPNCGKFVGAAPCPCGGIAKTEAETETGTEVVSDPAITATAGAGTSDSTPLLDGAGAAGDDDSDSDSDEGATLAPHTTTTTTTPSTAATAATGSNGDEGEKVTILFDGAAFATTFASALAPLLSPRSDQTATANPSGEIAEALTKVGAALEGMAERSAQMERSMATMLDRVADKLTRVAAVTPSPASTAGSSSGTVPTTAPAPTPPATAAPKPVEPAPVRPPKDKRNRTGVDSLLAEVEPPGPTDPYLMSVPPELGGQRIEPLPQYHQELDENYELTDDSANAIKTVAASLKIAWNSDPSRRPRGTQFRAFAFGGTSGTGKNTTARQVAAALGQPYYELTINKDTSIQEEIGQTVLTTDPVSGATISKAQLGKLGQAAASGAVICVNELVKANPGILGALQTAMEDGYIEIAGTEAGMAGGRIPVHPNTVFIGTWNPGYDGAAQRPDQALLSRMQTVMLNAPSIEQQTSRLQKEMNRLFGTGKVSKAKCEAAARFLSDVQRMARGGVGVGREIAKDSPFPVEPTPREIARFLATSEMTGDPLLALEQFKTYADAGEDFEDQWKRIKTVFSRHFGDDGQAINRKEAGKGPKIS